MISARASKSLTAARAAAAESAGAAGDLGSLPEWDLADLYPGRDSAELRRDLAASESAAAALRERYEGKLATLSGAALGGAIASYERLQETLGRIMSYAYLVYAGDMGDAEIGRFFQTMQERVNAITSTILFFTLELNRIDDEVLEAKLKDPALAHYAPWLRDTCAFRPYQLADEIEKLLHEKSIAGRSAWVRLFDETMAGLRFPWDSKSLTSAEVLHLLSDHDGAVRKRAATALGEVLGQNTRIFALITNTLAKDKEIEDRWRQFQRPISSRNLANFVEDPVVDALIAAVRAA